MIGKLTRTIVRTFAFALTICATTSAWAAVPVPTAIWDGNFKTARIPNWTLSANGNTVATDGSTITITKKGLTLTPSAPIPAATGVTVLVKMSDISTNNDNDQILVCTKQNNVGVMAGISMCRGARSLHGAWNGNAKWDNTNNGETSFTVPSSGDYYILFTSGNSSSTVREGFYEVGGTVNIKEVTDLCDHSNAIQMITIGGRPAVDGERTDNAVVKRILVYKGCLTSDEMKSAIDDIEGQSIIYNLAWQADGNKGALEYSNFMLPSSSYFMACGSASLNSSKALRSITIPWRPDTPVNSGGATSLYLAVTDSNNKLLALSSAADMSTVATKSSTTFNFTQAYISDNTQYRYWFISSNNYNFGDTISISVANRMGCSLYNIGSPVASMNSNTMENYTPASWIWCSNMTESEFTATAGGTAVSTSGAYADDITLKGVADGKFTIGELKAARITLADADVTIELDAGDSIKAQYIDNSSQKLVIDASNAATAVGTYTIFEGNLASTAASNFEVVFPTLGSGYDLYTTVTDNKISYQVDRTAVSATLTLTSDTSFSAEKTDINWVDSNHSSLEIVNNEASPITLAIDEDITAGSITVSGTGTTIIERGNSAVITATTVTVPAGSTLDATGSSITTFAGDGTFIWTTGYPTSVPSGITYQYVGGATAEALVTIPGVTVNGVLKTSGHLSLTTFSLVSAGTLEVLDGKTTVSGSAKGLAGTVIVQDDATLVTATDSMPNYDGTTVAHIYGTLDTGSNGRWCLYANNTVNLYAGATVKGTPGSGAINICRGAGLKIKAHPTDTTKTEVDFQGKLKYNRNNYELAGGSIITVDEGVAVVFSGVVTSHDNNGGYLRKQGLGKIKFASGATVSSLGVNLNIEAGAVDLGGVTLGGGSEGNVSVANGASLEVSGNSTISLPLTLADGAALKIDGSARLTVSQAVTLPTGESESVTLDVTDLTIPSEGYTLISGVAFTDADCDKFSITAGSGKYYALEPDGTTLKIYPNGASATINGTTTKYSKFTDAFYAFMMSNDATAYVTPFADAPAYSDADLLDVRTALDADGNYYKATVKIGSKGYKSLARAIELAADDDTVVLILNNTESNVTLNDKSVTFVEDTFTFSGSFTGNGTLIMTALPKSLATTLWSEGWTGTLWLKNITFPNIASGENAGKPTVNPVVFGNANSTLRLTSCSGGFDDDFKYDVTKHKFPGTLDLVDENDAPAFSVTSGWPKYGKTVFAKLTGTGTLTSGDPSKAHYYQFLDASEFRGTITIPSNGKFRVGIGSVDANSGNGDSIADRTLTIQTGASATIAAGKTWSAPGGFIIDGTLTIESNDALSSKAVKGGGTVVYKAAPNYGTTSPSFDASLWTGTVELPEFAADGIKLAEYGTGNSKIKINGITSGYLMWEDQNVQAEVVLAGDVNITATSHRNYTYAHISGTGSFSVSNSNASNADPNRLTITKLDVASGSVGMAVTNNTSTTLTINKLVLPAIPACDAKVLAVGGTGTISLDVSNIKTGVNEESLPAKYKLERRHKGEEGDGFYVYYNGTIFSVY